MALKYLCVGDTRAVWRLDQLGRSLSHLSETLTRLEQRESRLKSLTEQIDTTTAGGKLVFHIFGILAEFEINLVRERTQAGLQSARTRGRQGGRPHALSRTNPKTGTLAEHLYCTQQTPVGEICKLLGISRASFYRSLATKRGGTKEP